MRENMRYAHFLQNMRNMLRSHDRYKPVSLAKEMYDQQITYLSSNQRRTNMVHFLCCFAVKK